MTPDRQTYFRKGLGLKDEVKPVLESEYGSALVGAMKENDNRLDVGRLHFRLADSFGFCYGVDRAVEYAYEAREKFPDADIYLVGEIIHNPYVNRQLREMGITFLYPDDDGRFDFSGVNADDVVIVPAFGVSLSDFERLKEKGDFVTADVINVNPDTPNLDAMLQKFAVEHTHSEDEVRFTVKGSGIFHIHPDDGPVFAVLVESGDLINVPAGTKHWFNLCDDRTIRCIRLFEDPSGWTPHYVDEPVSGQYEAVCFGPNYLPADAQIDSVIKP